MPSIYVYQKRQYSNTYVFGEENGEAVIVDPGNPDNAALRACLKKHSMRLAAVLLTHGHYDHIAGAADLCNSDFTPCYISRLDEDCFEDPGLNASFLDGHPTVYPRPINLVALEGDERLNLAGLDISVVATPFHTRGSLCFYLPSNRMIFTGDTLFRGGIGRSDLPGSCPRLRVQSLRKLEAFYGDCVVYPGHGTKTRLEYEVGNFRYY